MQLPYFLVSKELEHTAYPMQFSKSESERNFRNISTIYKYTATIFFLPMCVISYTGNGGGKYNKDFEKHARIATLEPQKSGNQIFHGNSRVNDIKGQANKVRVNLVYSSQ